MNLKNGKVFTSKFVGNGPSSYEKRIDRSAVSQSLRNTGVVDIVNKGRPEKPRNCGLISSKGRQFLCAYTKLGKTTISLVMSVRLYGKTQYPLDEFL